MEIKAVSNTSPVLYLSQIEVVDILKLFMPLAIPPEVENELKKYKVSLPGFIRIIQLKPKTKDFAKLIALQYELDLGESEAIALVRQENAKLFFTDDLDARETAKGLGIEVHGSMGILLRSFRGGKISKKTAIEKIHELKNSGLFITSELIKQAINAIENYKA